MSDVAGCVLDRCDQLAAITARDGRIDRFHLTAEHARANTLVAGWMADAGMTTRIDSAGNVCGRIEGREPGLPALLLGSHLDTVPDAGRYDGPLGVVLAIEVVSRLDSAELPFAVEVIGFSDEEGARFGTALLGSRAVAGTWTPDLLDAADPDGVTVAEAMRAFGLDPGRVGEARRPDLVGYLEAHIEQGPELEAADLALGVVSSIAGARRFVLTVLGEARHAGGTPYPRRRDALIGASQAVLDIERIARAQGVIATVGWLETTPGAVNVIPGRVDFTVDLRAETDERRDSVWDEMLAEIRRFCAARDLELLVEETHRAPAVACDPVLMEAVRAGIESTGPRATPVLFSKAGHDAMAVAEVCPVGMLFIRCYDGISHHPDEAVLPEDVGPAADAFVAAVLQIAALRT